MSDVISEGHNFFPLAWVSTGGGGSGACPHLHHVLSAAHVKHTVSAFVGELSTEIGTLCTILDINVKCHFTLYYSNCLLVHGIIPVVMFGFICNPLVIKLKITSSTSLRHITQH